MWRPISRAQARDRAGYRCRTFRRSTSCQSRLPLAEARHLPVNGLNLSKASRQSADRGRSVGRGQDGGGRPGAGQQPDQKHHCSNSNHCLGGYAPAGLLNAIVHDIPLLIDKTPRKNCPASSRLPMGEGIRPGRALRNCKNGKNMAAHCIVAMLCDMLAEITTGYGTILIYEIATNKAFRRRPDRRQFAFRPSQPA